MQDIRTCPRCKTDEDVICYDEWLAKELMLCEKCDAYYEIHYELKVKEIKLK